jgi:hypothetical protein
LTEQLPNERQVKPNVGSHSADGANRDCGRGEAVSESVSCARTGLETACGAYYEVYRGLTPLAAQVAVRRYEEEGEINIRHQPQNAALEQVILLYEKLPERHKLALRSVVARVGSRSYVSTSS